MDSSTSRVAHEKLNQEEIKKQIALLQAQLIPDVDSNLNTTATSSSKVISPKRKQPEPTTLAPSTPSPRKKCKTGDKVQRKPIQPPAFGAGRYNARSLQSKNANNVEIYSKPAPSNLISRLSTLNRSVDTPTIETIIRSTGFTERAKSPPIDHAINIGSSSRDERLALIEDLEPGPYEHTPPSDDPLFQQLEPNSGIRLSSRRLPHEDLQDHLRGRYYLSPSHLYSSIRLLPDKQGYDVPVPGDWITIAVVAERGPLRFTRAPVTVGPEDGGELKGKGKAKGKESDAPTKSAGKKYVNFKLIDFGARSQRSSSATGGKAVIRGDAFLSLLLFESDGYDMVTREDGERPEKVYKGGSRGAFEALAKLKEGDVIALLNPKILKPFQRSNDMPHPVNNILALTPESAASIAVIGRSRDLGMCCVLKRDGKACGSWCDKRVSDVCEYHMQSAVQRQRAGRAEFAVGTSGMTTTSAPKRKPAYDPARQWGLKPETDTGSGSTYVVSGHVVSGTNTDPRTLFITESMGREEQAKSRRKLEGKDADRALKALLLRDKEGMKAVMKARETLNPASSSKKDFRRNKTDKSDEAGENFGIPGESLAPGKGKNAYTAEMVKQLGFDPTYKGGQRRLDDDAVQKKLRDLEAVRSARKGIALGPRPGPRIRSGVIVPQQDKKPFGYSENTLPSLNNSDDELPERILSDKGSSTVLIDLDDI